MCYKLLCTISIYKHEQICTLKTWKTHTFIYSIHKRTYNILQNVVHYVHSLQSKHETFTVPSFNNKNTVTRGKPKAAKTRRVMRSHVKLMGVGHLDALKPRTNFFLRCRVILQELLTEKAGSGTAEGGIMWHQSTLWLCQNSYWKWP